MTKLILPRRRFLFMAPAIIAASSLMPGHSIGDLEFTLYDEVMMGEDVPRDGLPSMKPFAARGYYRNGEYAEISRAEYNWNAARMTTVWARTDVDHFGTFYSAVHSRLGHK